MVVVIARGHYDNSPYNIVQSVQFSLIETLMILPLAATKVTISLFIVVSFAEIDIDPDKSMSFTFIMIQVPLVGIRDTRLLKS